MFQYIKSILRHFLTDIRSFFDFFLVASYKKPRFGKIFLKTVINSNQVISSTFCL